MKEEWRILNFEPNYEVSNFGLVRRKDNKRILKDKDNGRGYRAVHLSHGKLYYVHRLVAMCFLPNPNNYPQVNHINGDKSDNNVINLEWCTCSYNNKHAILIGLRKTTEKQRANSRLQISKLTPEQLQRGRKKSAITNKNKPKSAHILKQITRCKPIKCIELNKIFLCASRVEDKMGIKKDTITKALNRDNKICGGYTWKYLKDK